MVTKLKSMDKSDDNALLDAVCNSAHQIWQAGLGAFSRAREEGGDVFDKLVQEGMDLQKRTQHLASDKGFTFPDTVTKLAENVSRQATGSWEKLEKVFEDRVSRSLHSLGVPTQDDIKALSRKIDELNKSITAAMAEKKTAASAARKAAPAKKAVKAKAKATPKSATKGSAMKGAGRKTTRAPATPA